MSRFGPQIEEQGVRFRLWAPDGDGVRVEVDGLGETPLTAIGDGWREAIVPCAPGARYRFRLGELVFPDPAARAQAGGIHGWSVVVPSSQADTQWRGRPWQETVLYECHAGLLGGFDGVAQQLPALAALGVTAIELMPIAAFPGARNWGYDGVLPFAPVEAYGTPASLKALVDAAHRLGMMIFVDVVYNHFGPDGNYLPVYARSFFRTDVPTPWGAAIDFRVPQVAAFFEDNARQWLFEYGFDGLRFDAVHAIADQDWLDGLAKTLRREAGERHIHLVLENDDNLAHHLRPPKGGFEAQWNDDFHHCLHVLLTGETNGYYQDFAEAPAQRLAKALAEGFVYQGQASRNRNGAPRGEPSGDLAPTAFVAFLQNHDQTGNRPFGDRLTKLAEPQALEAAMALLLLSPQIPMLFMGEEIGSRAPFLYFTDHGPELAQAVREGRAREFAGFLDTAHGQTLPDANAQSTFAASRPQAEAPQAQAWRDLVSALLTLRRDHIMPRLAQARSLGAEAIGERAVLARWQLQDKRLTIAVNLGNEPVTATMPAAIPLWGHAADALAPYTTLVWLTDG